MADLAVRRATRADSAALFELHHASMGWAIEAVYGPWDDDVQARFHERWFDPRRVWVIEHDAELAGLLDYTFHEDRLTIDRIQLHPSHQNHGIGTALLRHLCEEADRRGLPAELEVFDINPARRLYERLGFRETGREGPKVYMRRPAGRPTSTASTTREHGARAMDDSLDT